MHSEKKLLAWILTFSLLTFFSSVSLCSGKTYYVAQKAPLAADKNPGTETSPWKTIQKAADTLMPGDTVYVKEGTYREIVRPRRSGKPGKRITYQTYPGDTVVIKGSEVVTGWKRYKGNIWMKKDWCLENFQIPESKYKNEFFRGHPHGWSDDPWFIFWEDAPLEGAKFLTRVDDFSSLHPGTLFTDRKKRILYIWLQNGEDPNKHTIEVAVRCGGFWLRWEKGDYPFKSISKYPYPDKMPYGMLKQLPKDYITISGFQIRHIGPRISQAIGNYGNFTIIEDCLLSWCAWHGTGTLLSNNIIRNNRIAFCALTGLIGGGDNHKIIGNHLSHCNMYHYGPGGTGAATKFLRMSHSIIAGNIVEKNFGGGIWLDFAREGNIVENNICRDNQGFGIMIEITPMTVVRNNLCYNNKSRLGQYSRFYMAGARNLPDKPYYLGGSGYSGMGIYISQSPETKIYNNLCFANVGVGIQIHGTGRACMPKEWYDGVPASQNIKIFNNICINNYRGQMCIETPNGAHPRVFGNEADYNLLYSIGPGKDRMLIYGNQILNSVEQIAAMTDLGMHWVIPKELDEPIFNYSEWFNFHLAPQSIACDAGKTLSDVPTDFDGVKRPVGKKYDIGPFEGTTYALSYLKTFPVSKKPHPAKNLKYFTVDLSKYINRSYEDEVADDGEGSWNDEGPERDLHAFPTGRQIFKKGVDPYHPQVPFDINPRGCVVLRSKYRRAKDLPLKIEIPINKKPKVLYFLHTGAFVRKDKQETQAKYIIHYEDGHSKEIRLKHRINFHDWEDGGASTTLRFEDYTTSFRVWLGRIKGCERTSLLAMEWVNPVNWCDITKIDFVGSNLGIVALLAITGGEE